MSLDWDDIKKLVASGEAEQALFLLRRMVEDKRYSALVEIGLLYESLAKDATDKRYEQAATYYKKAIEYIDDPYGYQALGRLYFFGAGVEQSYQNALKNFLIASKHGKCVSDLMIARMYRYGHGVEMNSEKAYFYYDQAIHKGSYVGIHERGFFDIRNMRLLRGIKDFLKGTVLIFKQTKKDMLEHGLIVSDSVKMQ